MQAQGNHFEYRHHQLQHMTNPYWLSSRPDFQTASNLMYCSRRMLQKRTLNQTLQDKDTRVVPKPRPWKNHTSNPFPQNPHPQQSHYIVRNDKRVPGFPPRIHILMKDNSLSLTFHNEIILTHSTQSFNKIPLYLQTLCSLVDTVFYMNGVIFQHDKLHILKWPPNERC